MSFVIGAIHKGVHLCMAADTKMTSQSGIMEYEDVRKVFKISDTTAVGIAGDYYFAKSVLEDWHCKGMSRKVYLDALRGAAARQNAEWRKRYSRDFNASFVLVGQQLMRPYVSLSVFEDGRFMTCYEPFTAGDYQYFFSCPVDVPHDVCKSICDRVLGEFPEVDTKTKLHTIVKLVAGLSNYVNDTADVWTVNVMGREV